MKLPTGFRWNKTGRQLGEGGQASVYEVTDSTGEFPNQYAMKAMRAGKPLKAYERFAREVAAIKACNHRQSSKFLTIQILAMITTTT